jgi:hypothetical protein
VNIAQVAAFLSCLAAIALGTWIGLRLIKNRRGLAAVQKSNGGRAAVLALITGAVVLGLWIGNRGESFDPGTIALGFVLWLIAMFTALRRPKRG